MRTTIQRAMVPLVQSALQLGQASGIGNQGGGCVWRRTTRNGCQQPSESQIVGARELASKAAGVLVFPSVVKAGLGLGGEYGEGLLIIRGRPSGYYDLISGSFGFQLGVQTRTVIIMFMTEQALASFESTYGWKVGVDGSVAIVTLGAGGAIDTESLTSPVLGFILDPAGLMYNLTLEGSKISRITR